MNGIENIVNKIASDANARVGAILARAREEASKTEAEYKSRADAETSAIIESGRKSSEEREKRLGGVAQLEAKKRILAKKQELISRAFALAVEKLESLSDDERAKTLAGLALSAADGGAGEIILSPEERVKIGEKILEYTAENKKITLSEETRDISGLVLKNGKTETNCTFSSLVNSLREEMSVEIAGILFG